MSAIRPEFVYLVYWPDQRIVKVGVTAGSRWLLFVRRGARVAAVTPFDSTTDALDYEGRVLDYLDIQGKEAFASPLEAGPYLGLHGSGWRECRRFDADLADVLAGVPIVRARQGCLPI